MTKYQLNLDTIREDFKFNSKITHNINKVKFLPYSTKFKESKTYDFREIASEFTRLVAGKQLTGSFESEQLLEKVINQVKFEEPAKKSQFRQLVTILFFTENNQLQLNHPNYFYYTECKSNENKKIAQFLFEVLVRGQRTELEIDSATPDDVLTKLIFDSLPALESTPKRESHTYVRLFDQVSQLFLEDYTWLVKKPKLYVQHLDKLLKYYYFFYVSQFVLSCEAMFKTSSEVIRPLYFNLEWESTSQARTSYTGGWIRLEKTTRKLFSHAICLEFLNHTNDSLATPYMYGQIRHAIEALEPDELEVVANQLDQVINDYQKGITDVPWEQFPVFDDPYENLVLNKMYRLYRIIDFQFDGSDRTRNKNYQEYKNWFSKFCDKAFLKSRGRIGKTLNLNVDYLLFLTKLILKDEKKVRLKQLFKELENRGVSFDRDSQNVIVEYFEAINILEKKSDSGDALYVKSFL